MDRCDLVALMHRRIMASVDNDVSPRITQIGVFRLTRERSGTAGYYPLVEGRRGVPK
jgi:hypothetical protein